MSFMWFMLGALLTGALWLLVSMKRKSGNKVSASGLIGLSLSILTALFAIAWAVSSLAEEEIRAAGMGIVVFGGIALILFIIAWRTLTRGNRIIKNENSKSI